MTGVQDKQIHVLMFPYFAFGHISPFVQLSNKLSSHGFRVSFLSAPGNIHRIKSSLLLTPKAEIIPLQIPPVDGLPPGLDSTAEMTPAMAELLKQALDLMKPQIKNLLSQLNPDFVFFDFAHYWLPKLASDLGIKSVKFSVFSAIADAYVTVPERSPKNRIPTVVDLQKPPNGFPSTSLTSIKQFQAKNLMYMFTSFNGGPTAFERNAESVTGCTALLYKSSKELEGPYIEFLKSQFQKPVLLSAPLVPKPPSSNDVLDEKWAKWVIQFPSKSIIFCNFGSETFLKDEEIEELALGLELSGLPFILVLNFPGGVEAEAELNRVLPKGFPERVKNRGIVHTGWVPQRLILGHESVGCYLCHAGFSSLIEALVNDCQLLLLPLKGDQFLNSKLCAGDMKAGVEVNRRDEDGYFGKEDISEAIRAVMADVDKEPCKTVRECHKKWREYLMKEEIEDEYIVELVKELKALLIA